MAERAHDVKLDKETGCVNGQAKPGRGALKETSPLASILLPLTSGLSSGHGHGHGQRPATRDQTGKGNRDDGDKLEPQAKGGQLQRPRPANASQHQPTPMPMPTVGSSPIQSSPVLVREGMNTVEEHCTITCHTYWMDVLLCRPSQRKETTKTLLARKKSLVRGGIDIAWLATEKKGYPGAEGRDLTMARKAWLRSGELGSWGGAGAETNALLSGNGHY